MCGRFVSARQRRELIEEFGVERDLVTGDVTPDYNVAPTRQVYAVLARRPGDTEGADGTGGRAESGRRTAGPEVPAGDGGPASGPSVRTLRLVRWGLVPSWAKDPSAGARLINARAETVAVKPSFRSAFARRRCLIPADGFYEWRPASGHGHPRKQPYYLRRADGGVLAFAGIYELWRDGRLPGDHPGAWLWTAAIVTTRATDDLGWIHDRMPTVIAPARWTDWLDPGFGSADSLREAMLPAASAGLAVYPVSTAVNSVGNNGPGLIEPAEVQPGENPGAGGGPRSASGEAEPAARARSHSASAESPAADGGPVAPGQSSGMLF